jgi:glycerol uptake facilitator-like aquaporin
LAVMVFYSAKISAAHLNPAISLTFTILGYINPFQMLVYWAAQITGCIFGAMWLAFLIPTLSLNNGGGEFSGCYVPDDSLTDTMIFGWEAMTTLFFILPVFSVVWYTATKDGYGNVGPIIIGLSLAANACAVGQWTGAALNPARVIGSFVIFQCKHAHAMHYILGELLAGCLAPLLIVPWYGLSLTPWYQFNNQRIDTRGVSRRFSLVKTL